MNQLVSILFLVINLSSVFGYYYDITTVYKFNVYEESDQNGGVNRTYLNTCAVSVHPQTNAIGVPYMNIKDSQLDVYNVTYPLQSATIPTLNVPFENSQWKNLSMSDAMEPLKIKLFSGVDFLDSGIFKSVHKEDRFALLKQNARVIRADRKRSYSQSHSYVIFDSVTMSAINKEQNVFLLVQLEKNNIIDDHLDFTFLMKKLDGEYVTIKVHKHNSMEVCSRMIHCKSFIYQSDQENHISLFITLKGNLMIYDAVGKNVFYIDEKRNYFSSIEQQTSYDYYARSISTTYEIVQLSAVGLCDETSIVSPWLHISYNSLLFISYYRKSNAKVITFMTNADKEELLQLQSEEQNVSKLSLSNIESDVDELVLVRIYLKFPQTWTQAKQIQIKADKDAYITNIWEGGNQDMYRIYESKLCLKSNITDIFDVDLKDPEYMKKITNNVCFNGGFLDKFKQTCICPPGFTGNNCEMACGRNYFGQKCSKLCSNNDIQCRGMIVCTPSYGCTCAPGLYGDQCLQECEEGTFGADCKQTCGQCKSGCDKYTGNCRGECDSPYLIWPSCKYLHSYWRESPVILGSSFDSVQLSLNFSATNIEKSFDNTQFFLVQYREDTETTWNNCSYDIFKTDIADYTVQNLKPGRRYLFRGLLVDETLNTNNPQFSKSSIGMTLCESTQINNNINATDVTNSSISLVWHNKTDILSGNECPFVSYTLEITDRLHDSVETIKIFNIKKNSIVVKSLTPGTLYHINLKKNTIYGESSMISNTTVQTESTTDNTLDVTGIVKKKLGSEVQLQWFKSPISKTYFIKYKLLRRLSCSQNEILESFLQVVSTNNTNYTLILEPNAQYVIFITLNQNQMTSLQNFTIITGATLPSISPSLLKYKFRVTNESVQVYWTDPPAFCRQMNGFFKKYIVTLSDSHSIVVKTYELLDKKTEITGLIPKTDYKIRISYMNHVGLNPQIYLEHSFSTKATSFLIVQDFTAYKTSAHLIGLRWKMPDTNITITGVNVNVQCATEKKSFNITDFTDLKCKAWPSYVCYTIPSLKQNTKYEVSVEIFSEEFPEGGLQKNIQAVTRETIPSPVSDIKFQNIVQENMTISWRIPNLLNGILRKFQIEVEHLSIFDETLCCQNVSTINYINYNEQEIYFYVLENIQSASSYQVTIKAFTRRLGQEASKIIDTPPSLIPITQIPHVSINDEKVVWQEQTYANNMTSTPNALISDILVIVQSNNIPNNIDKTVSPSASVLRTELDCSLNSSNWWIAHVCGVQEDCLVKIGAEDESDSPYGKITNKPLTEGHNYTVILAQVNKYLSARSYTIVKSAPFLMKRMSTTTETIESTSNYKYILPTESNDQAKSVKENDYEELKPEAILPTENTDQGHEETTESEDQDYVVLE